MADSTPWIAAEAGADTRKHAPATLRNREPIAEALGGLLPIAGTVLEVASGSGEHAAYFAEVFPALTWQPSDHDDAALASIDAWCAGLANLRPAVRIDALSHAPWPVAHADAIFCANMVHIAPWDATLGLMAGAGRLLAPGSGAPLILYGPFRRNGVETAASNEAFDQSLKARDPNWGLRVLEDVAAVANDNGLLMDRVIEMPANNIIAVFRRG